MLRLLFAVTLILCGPAQADTRRIQVTTATYTLSLSDDWVEAPSTDTEQRSFDSKSRDVHFVVSSMPMSIPLSRTEEVAQFVVGRRVELERELAAERGQQATIDGPYVINQPWGQSIAYTGAFSRGRQFHFGGAVTTRQVLSLYVESGTLSQADLAEVMLDVTRDLDFPVD